MTNLKSAAYFPIVFVVLASIINNAWLPSLVFASNRVVEVTAFSVLSFLLLLNAKLLFTMRFAMAAVSLGLYYLSVGVLNNSFSITSTILASLFWINCLIVYLTVKRINFDHLVWLIKFLIASQFILLVAVDLVNWIVRLRGLPILIETILPLAIFGILLLGVFCEDKKKLKRLYLITLLGAGYFFVSIFADWHFNEQKFQKIQLGLVAFTIAYFYFLNLFHRQIEKGRLFYIFSPVNILILAAVYLAFNIVDIATNIIALQPSSGYLRFAVNAAMLNDMSPVSLILGNGMGSSFKYFNVTDLHPDSFLFEYDEMFPHNGLLVLFYEYGAIGVIIAALWIVSHLWIRNKTDKAAHSGFAISRSLASWLFLGLLFFFLFQNGMYVQGVPSGDLYFQSNTVLYLLMIRLIFMYK